MNQRGGQGPLSRRRAGVLLHPTSLPGDGFCGTLGGHARRFVDLIAASGLSIWQLLPLTPTHGDRSPYQSYSAHAGNTDLIDLAELTREGWLATEALAGAHSSASGRQNALRAAASVFAGLSSDSVEKRDYREFLERSAHWLPEFARFSVFRQLHRLRPWTSWEEGLRNRDAACCAALALRHSDDIEAVYFCQWLFDRQWRSLREYAAERGVLMFGDMPIYLHLDSADVWAHRELFDLDANGRPNTLTGVPPDYFAAEGQLWGNPQYHWKNLQASGFDWWLQRFATAYRQLDVLRIDHFRALDAYWEIPAHAATAVQGHWVRAPGAELLERVRDALPSLCLVAENLGVISPEVERLRKRFELPGMRVLQFAFDGKAENPYLPHNHEPIDVVYTGTHDNDTSQGWFDSLDDATRRRVYAYCSESQEAMPWMLIRQAMLSVCNTAIVPWQDFLALGHASRLNTPGLESDVNWAWRFAWDQVPGGLAERILGLVEMYGRSDPGPQ